jgi:transposase
MVRYLPPCLPNLNPIERVWKLLKKEVINSYCYENLAGFRHYVMGFFEHAHTWKKPAPIPHYAQF